MSQIGGRGYLRPQGSEGMFDEFGLSNDENQD